MFELPEFVTLARQGSEGTRAVTSSETPDG
jgi:hypothetical protein